MEKDVCTQELSVHMLELAQIYGRVHRVAKGKKGKKLGAKRKIIKKQKKMDEDKID